MLQRIFLSVLMFFGSLASVNADDDFQPTIVPHLPKAVYLTNGFDSNDNVQVTFEGYYSNTCYRKGLTTYEVDKQNHVIYVADMAHYYNQQFCAEIIIPYVKTLDVGILDAGTYQVLFKNNNGGFDNFGTLPIKKATSEMPDDYLYANVEDAIFTPAQPYSPPLAVTPAVVELKGHHHTDCIAMDRVETIHEPGSNVIAILPVTKLTSVDCQLLNPPAEFSQKVLLDGYSKGRYLLHIRSLNGQSVNRLVDLK